MVFFSGVVVGSCGGAFVFEIAEVESFAVADDGGSPEAFLPVEVYPFIS